MDGPFRKAKEFVSLGNSRSYSRQVCGFDRADIGAPLIKGSVSTASSVACLRVWGRLPDGWTSLTMPRSKRQPHLEVLFVLGQVVWMRLGWPGPGKAKFSFSEGA